MHTNLKLPHIKEMKYTMKYKNDMLVGKVQILSNFTDKMVKKYCTRWLQGEENEQSTKKI